MAGAIIAPTSAVIDSGGPGFGSINQTFNQAGLLAGYVAGVTDFDTYLAGNPMHDFRFSGNEWFSNSGTTSATVTYDFGSAMTFDRLALWNEDASAFGSVDILTSNDLMTFTSLLIGVSGTDNVLNSNYGADVFSFGPRTARYVVFEMSRCPQSGTAFPGCAIGEVAFRSTTGAVPEPATWAMMLTGFAFAGYSMRRRRATVRLATA